MVLRSCSELARWTKLNKPPWVPPLARLPQGSATFFPWVMGTAMVTKPHGSWDHTSLYNRYKSPWVMGLYNNAWAPWVMGLYNNVWAPWLMGLYNIIQWPTPSMGDGVVQCCTTTHPLHGWWGCTTLYNSSSPPWVMGLYNIVQLSVGPMGHETYDYPRKIYNWLIAGI